VDGRGVENMNRYFSKINLRNSYAYERNIILYFFIIIYTKPKLNWLLAAIMWVLNTILYITVKSWILK